MSILRNEVIKREIIESEEFNSYLRKTKSL